MLLKLAFRNVFRNKRRTFITFTAISFGLAAMIVGKALMDGIDLDSQRNIINFQTAHLKIFADGYFDKKDDMPLNLTISEPKLVMSALDSIPQIRGIEPRVSFGGLLINRTEDLGCMFIGIDPLADPDVFDLNNSLLEGRFLAPQKEEMLIGVDLARTFNVELGDILTLETVMADSARNAIDLEVAGIFETGNPIVDNGTVFIPLDVAQELLNLGDQVTEIAAKLDRLEQLSQAAKQMSAVLAKLGLNDKVFRWDQIAGDFLEISKMKVKFMALISLIMIVIATFGITNTMLMATMERTREIGMMAALGMKQRNIMFLFIIESGIIGLLGSLLGCILGAALSLYIEIVGIDYSSMGESFKDLAATTYPITGAYYADLRWEVLVWTFIFGVIVSMLAGVWAAWRASRLEPTDALRYV